MEWTVTVRKQLSFSSLEILAGFAGNDILIYVGGGDRPHLGCAVLTLPRPSLLGNGKSSCTSSVLNRNGHKDEVLCRRLAERICCRFQAVTVCTGGLHIDKITEEQLQEIEQAMDGVEEQLIRQLETCERNDGSEE